jgi:hypothetical protein
MILVSFGGLGGCFSKGGLPRRFFGLSAPFGSFSFSSFSGFLFLGGFLICLLYTSD